MRAALARASSTTAGTRFLASVPEVYPRTEKARDVIITAIMAAMSMLGGWLLFRFVESPMMRRFGRKRTKPVVLVEGADPKSPDVGEERSAA